jgi:RHS repeat-associated protein
MLFEGVVLGLGPVLALSFGPLFPGAPPRGPTTRYTRLDSVSAADQEGLIRMKVSSLAGSGSVAYARIETRADATYANYYRYQVQFGATGAIAIVIRKSVAGSISTLRSDSNVVTGFAASDWLWLRWKVTTAGSDVALTYKAWKDGTSEPASFATTVTDPAPGSPFTGAGRFMLTSQALSGYSGGYPYLVDYDDLSIATPGATADTTAPSVPADLVARPAGSAQIDLAWTGSTDAVGVHAYRVYRGGTYVATVGSTSWSDTALAPSTFYAYTVSAIDGAGNESPATGAAALTTTPDGATTYTYDAAGNRLTAAAGAATISATYDRLNRPLTVDDDDLGSTPDTTYTYSLTSPSWTDPTGAYSATLDAFDRPTSVNDPANATDFAWSYRADGQLAASTQPNGNATDLAYDALGRLTGSDTDTTPGAGGTDRAVYAWTRNRAGQILSEASTITGDASNGTVTYGYDPLGRLTGATLGATTTTYAFDADVNRTSVGTGAGTVTTTFDAADRPTSDSAGGTYGSDPDGRLTAAPGYQYTWDHLGRLTSVKDGSGTTLATYRYDPLDRLRVVEHPGVDRTRLRYVGLTTSVAQWLDDVAGSVTRSVANGWGGERLADWTGSGANLRVYGSNAHHDVTWTASSSGTVSASLRYDPWGTPRGTIPSGYPPFRFQGSWSDEATGLSWAVSRWYAPALGRFISEDSLLGEPSDPPSRHLYAYGAGEPVGRWDPDGRFWYRVRSGDTYGVISSRFFGRNTVNLRKLIREKNPGIKTLGPGLCLWVPKAASSTREANYRLMASCRDVGWGDLWRPDRPSIPNRSGYTAGFCATVSAGAGVYGTSSGCVTKDNTGRKAYLVTIGGGGAVGFSCCFSVGLEMSNGTINDMTGWFTFTGGSVGWVHGTYAGDISWSDGQKVISVYGGWGIKLELPVAGEVYLGRTYTWNLGHRKWMDSVSMAPAWAIVDAALYVQGIWPH